MAARPPLTESAALESYAAAGAQADAASGVPYSHFQNTQGGGVALAENEVLTQSLNILGGTVQSAMRAAMDGFCGEGPGGGHYQNLEGPFSAVGCGVYIANQRITLIQDFR
jgi:cysteine-rich secretory family protein